MSDYLYGISEIYCDGGVITKNPSKLGGTWAYILRWADGRDVHASGVVTPENIGLDAVTNNYTELLAAVNALEKMPNGWFGVLYTDSNVTRCRLIGHKPKMEGIPEDLEFRMMTVRARLGNFRVVLLDGHPSKKHLEDGKGKRGQPVSKYNKQCDDLCKAEAKIFLAKIEADKGKT